MGWFRVVGVVRSWFYLLAWAPTFSINYVGENSEGRGIIHNKQACRLIIVGAKAPIRPMDSAPVLFGVLKCWN